MRKKRGGRRERESATWTDPIVYSSTRSSTIHVPGTNKTDVIPLLEVEERGRRGGEGTLHWRSGIEGRRQGAFSRNIKSSNTRIMATITGYTGNRPTTTRVPCIGNRRQARMSFSLSLPAFPFRYTLILTDAK